MPKGGGKRAKREPVKVLDDGEAEAALDVEFPVHEVDGYEVPLVCRDASEYYSVMDVLFWPHHNSLEAGIMRFFDTKEVLRLVHSEFRNAVSATPWHDLRTVIKGPVASWRDGCEVPLVCRDASEYYSVMGVLFGSHYNSLEAGIMRFFDTKEACVLRLVHSEFRDAVSATPWHDLRTKIKGSVASWRECFGLRAQAASVNGREDLVDADFVHFRGLAALDMDWAAGFSVVTYANMRGISCLKMAACAISVGAVSHLKGVQEIGMWGCDLAVTAPAFELLQGVRSMVLNSQQNPMSIAIEAGDLPEIRRLLATRSIGSASWLYAGVSFHDVSAPSTSNDVVASACIELLQFGIEVESTGIIWEAAGAICNFTLNKHDRKVSFVSIGVVAALVIALKLSVCWTDAVTCGNVCSALTILASIEDGRVACRPGNTIPIIVPLLKYHRGSSHASAKLCRALTNMVFSLAGTAACISSGGVYEIVATLRWHAGHEEVCSRASRALRNISGFSDGVAACLSADAVPYLLAVYESHPSAREHAGAALWNLGVED